jgi:hypothetical protein
MIGSVDSSQMAMLQQTSGSSSSSSGSLNYFQLETISSVLENYDADNLSQSDAQSIVAAFEDAGIEPSAELASEMEEAGFDAKEVGSLAGVQGSGPGGGMPPPPPAEETDSISSLLDTLLNTQEDEESTTTTSFDDIMDYTSRILSLNEESKTEVMDLLDKYSSEETEYTAEETNDLLKTSLSQILSDTNNYKSVSFYG